MSDKLKDQVSHSEDVSDEEFEIMMERKYRKAVRKWRNRDPEVGELNLTAMMDMLTILLVYLIKSYNANPAADLQPGVSPPVSSSQWEIKESVAISISNDLIVVDQEPVVKLVNGEIPEEFASGSGSAVEITPLADALDAQVEKMRAMHAQNMGPEFEGKALIIGDKKTPYKLLSSILYTAGQSEFSQFQFVILKK